MLPMWTGMLAGAGEGRPREQGSMRRTWRERCMRMERRGGYRDMGWGAIAFAPAVVMCNAVLLLLLLLPLVRGRRKNKSRENGERLTPGLVQRWAGAARGLPCRRPRRPAPPPGPCGCCCRWCASAGQTPRWSSSPPAGHTPRPPAAPPAAWSCGAAGEVSSASSDRSEDAGGGKAGPSVRQPRRI